MVAVTAAQLCHFYVKAAIEDSSINEHGWVPVKLYLQTPVVGMIYPLFYTIEVMAISA